MLLLLLLLSSFFPYSEMVIAHKGINNNTGRSHARARVDLYINVLHTVRPCVRVRVCGLPLCGVVVYAVRCCDGDQYDAVCVTSAPQRARRPMVGDWCRSAP